MKVRVETLRSLATYLVQGWHYTCVQGYESEFVLRLLVLIVSEESFRSRTSTRTTLNNAYYKINMKLCNSKKVTVCEG